MIISGNQPYFLPYIGYWQLIAAADIFIIGDDYSFIKGGWITRNRILDVQTIRPFSLSINSSSSNKLISELFLTDNPRLRTKLLYQVKTYYHKAPHFEIGYSILEKILSFPDLNLANFLEHSIRVICSYLGIRTVIRKSSEFHTYGTLFKQHRIFEYCKQLNADTYINAIGGKDIYNVDEFKNNGISLYFLKSLSTPYHQFSDTFYPDLSILDAIMFCSQEELQKILSYYSLVQ